MDPCRITAVVVMLCGCLLAGHAAAQESPGLPGADLWSRLGGALPRQQTPWTEMDLHNTCADIYGEVSRLVPATRKNNPRFLEDPRNAIAGAVGTVYPIAYLAWGYTAFEGYQAKQSRTAARERVTELRSLLARKQCFIK